MKKTILKETEAVHHLCFSDDGKYLISLKEKSISLWHLSGHREMANLLDLEEEFCGMHTKIFRTSTENVYCLVNTGWDHPIYGFIEINDSKIVLLGKIKTNFDGFYQSFQVINDQIILADGKGWVIYHLNNFSEASSFSHPLLGNKSKEEIDVAIHPDGTKVAFLHFSKSYLQVCSAIDGNPILKVEHKKAFFDEGDGPCLRFRPNTNELYTYRKYGKCVSFNVWDTETGQLIENEKALDYTFGNKLENMQISDDGQYLWMTFQSKKEGAQILCWKLKKRNKETLWKLDGLPNNATIDFCPVSDQLALSNEQDIVLLKKNNVSSFFE